MPSITLRGVTFSYPSKPGIIRGLCATLSAPEGRGWLVAIMGPSGCGKSTLLRLLAGAELAQSGQIEAAPKGCLLSYLAQEPVLLEHLKKKESVSVFARLSATKGAFDPQLLEHLLDELEIAEMISGPTPLVHLSGGEKQRLCLARSLSVRPSILLLDEPCTGLDPYKKFAFLKKLRMLVDEYRILAVYVTHHADEVRLICDAVAFMRSGQDGVTELCQQPVSDFLNRPPSPEATQILLPELMNQLLCLRQGSEFYLAGTAEVVGHTREAATNDESCVLLFDPNAIEPSSNGFKCNSVSASDVYTFIKPVSQQESLLVSAKRVKQGSVILRGEALVFPTDRPFGYRTVLL